MTDYVNGPPVKFGKAIAELEECLDDFKKSREAPETPPWPYVMSAGKTMYLCRKCGYDYEGGRCGRHED